MKPCAILAVSAAIFTAKVYAADFLVMEQYSETGCPASSLMKRSFLSMQCNGPSSEGRDGTDYQGVYSQASCTSTSASLIYYSDSACTEVHPNVSAHDFGALNGCDSDSHGNFDKNICPFAVPDDDVLEWAAYATSDGSCGGDPIQTGSTFLRECTPDSDFDGGTGNWTEKGETLLLSGGTLTDTKYNTKDCSDAGTNHPLSPWTCGVCDAKPRGDGPRDEMITCPSDTVGAPRGASPGALLAAAAAALGLAVAGAA